MTATASAISHGATLLTAMRTGITNGAVVGKTEATTMYQASGYSLATGATNANSSIAQVSAGLVATLALVDESRHSGGPLLARPSGRLAGAGVSAVEGRATAR